MGKSRKFGLGNMGKRATDYNRHVVEGTAELEGFGNSGRVGMDTTLPEESCSPKRNCICLNGAGYDRCGAHVQVFSLSKMSMSERKELVVRLKRELEEVRIFQRRVASLNVGVGAGAVVSPRSCIDGQKRPLLESGAVERPIQGKKRVSPMSNGARVEPPRQIAPVNAFNPVLMKQCTDLVNRMLAHRFGGDFKEPVDVVKFNIPDYFNVVKHPMDFGTIKRKLASGEYSSPQGFAADVRLTFSNAMTYNPPLNVYHSRAQTLSKYFEQRWKDIEKKIPVSTVVQRLPPMMNVEVHNEVAMCMGQVPPLKKKKVSPVGFMGKVEPLKRVMSDAEKHRLSLELEAHIADLPESIIDFLEENRSGDGPVEEDEIEIDIDALSDDILFKLRKLVDDFLTDRKKQLVRAEPSEMELHIESGFSNSSIQPGNGNAAADEDIDIGGNDHPVTSFRTIEIEKDAANKNIRCDSPSSSSSGSGSSSSGSDSGSLSSESEGARAVPLGDKIQGTLSDKSKVDQKRNIIQDDGKTQSWNSLSKVGQTPQIKPPSFEAECDKEGESAPSERQISPNKLYRAALLRSRFADTILKAQEKTLDKGEKRDPEILRLEREELERRQREEKARLQAEAKAAEDARRKAEAEGATEAKRKREVAREAARLALQKMEKTVEINENCPLMEDLEMLGAAPVDNLSKFIGDMSPNGSQNGGLGSFRFRGNSNPLEQLGLFRKDDDEEEEEVEAPHIVSDPPAIDIDDVDID